MTDGELQIVLGDQFHSGGLVADRPRDDLGTNVDESFLGIVAKLGQFRGESKFTTWAYKFVIFEVSAKIGRHFWSSPAAPMDAEDWERLPGRFGADPAQQTERRELAGAVRRS